MGLPGYFAFKCGFTCTKIRNLKAKRSPVHFDRAQNDYGKLVGEYMSKQEKVL